MSLRQPDRIQIVPSKPFDWYGTWSDSERFTVQQRRCLSDLGIDPAAVDELVVLRKAQMAEMWWPEGHPAPVFEMPCPVLRRLADGRVKVISPAGINRIVQDDGWITRRASWAAKQQKRNAR